MAAFLWNSNLFSQDRKGKQVVDVASLYNDVGIMIGIELSLVGQAFASESFFFDR